MTVQVLRLQDSRLVWGSERTIRTKEFRFSERSLELGSRNPDLGQNLLVESGQIHFVTVVTGDTFCFRGESISFYCRLKTTKQLKKESEFSSSPGQRRHFAALVSAGFPSVFEHIVQPRCSGTSMSVLLVSAVFTALHVSGVCLASAEEKQRIDGQQVYTLTKMFIRVVFIRI